MSTQSEQLSESEIVAMMETRRRINPRALERTDHDIVPDHAIRVIPDAVKIAKMVIDYEKNADQKNDPTFHNPTCWVANKSLKSDDSYGLDKYGIVVRRRMYNMKTKAYGWVYDECGDITSIFYNPMLSEDENIKHILNIQYKLQPTSFGTNGVIYKIYHQDPKLQARFDTFIHSTSMDN